MSVAAIILAIGFITAVSGFRMMPAEMRPSASAVWFGMWLVGLMIVSGSSVWLALTIVFGSPS